MNQGTPEWHRARLGKATASRMSDLLARTKAGWGAARGNYMTDLMTERLTGLPVEGFVSREMQWGTTHEPDARAAYEFLMDVEVQQVGFVDHPAIAHAGASPDGLVGRDGMVEIKCPTSATHVDTLLNQKPPEKHLPQIQWQMACTGRTWCDFVSFDPRMPAPVRLFVHRIYRDDEYIKRMEAAVTEFLAELDQKLASLGAPPPVPPELPPIISHAAMMREAAKPLPETRKPVVERVTVNGVPSFVLRPMEADPVPAKPAQTHMNLAWAR